MVNKIKLGVRVFSFRNTKTLEDAIKTIVKIGADAFDVTASMTIKGYPWPSEQMIEYVTGLCSQYKVKLISYDGNVDLGMRCDRRLTEDEMFGYALNDIYYAHRFGAEVHRIQWLLPPSVLARLAPYAEAYDVKAGVEIHSPLIPSSPAVKAYVRMFEKAKSNYIGLIPDFGSLADRPIKFFVDDAMRTGTKTEIMDCMIDGINNKLPESRIEKQIRKMGATEQDVAVLHHPMFHQWEAESDLEGLKDILPYCIHFHGKFFGFDEDGNDINIPVGKILPIIRDFGYDGYIASEYEGNKFTSADPVDQIVKQRALYQKILESCD